MIILARFKAAKQRQTQVVVAARKVDEETKTLPLKKVGGFLGLRVLFSPRAMHRSRATLNMATLSRTAAAVLIDHLARKNLIMRLFRGGAFGASMLLLLKQHQLPQLWHLLLLKQPEGASFDASIFDCLEVSK